MTQQQPRSSLKHKSAQCRSLGLHSINDNVRRVSTQFKLAHEMNNEKR